MAMRPDVGMAGSSGYPTERFGPGGEARSKLQGNNLRLGLEGSNKREYGIQMRSQLGVPMSTREQDYVKAGVGSMTKGGVYIEDRQRNLMYDKYVADKAAYNKRIKLTDHNKDFPQAQYSASPQMNGAYPNQGRISAAMQVKNTKPGQ